MPLLTVIVLFLTSLVLQATPCRSWKPVDANLADLTGLNPAMLETAGEEARWLLKSLCVELRWSDHATGAVPLQIQVLSRPLIPINDDCLGFAIPALGHAAVFLSRIRQTEAYGDRVISLPTFLGCVIAHEIGHLLLHSSRHSDRGLMSASFTEKHMLAARQRRLLFSESDRKALNSLEALPSANVRVPLFH
jgi:hypothetical protein